MNLPSTDFCEILVSSRSLRFISEAFSFYDIDEYGCGLT